MWMNTWPVQKIHHLFRTRPFKSFARRDLWLQFSEQ